MRDMNYVKIYDRIIERAKVRTLNCYKERHHILPRCMGGSNDELNLVDLTPEEHYVCHQLLVKIHPNNRKILYAALAMSMSGGAKLRSNKLYGWLRKKLSLAKKKEKVEITCVFCQRACLVHTCHKNTKYCSLECKHNSKKIIKICPTCNKSFSKIKSKETTYCSQLCARINFKPPNQTGKKYGERVTQTCFSCKKDFTKLKCLAQQSNKKVFCSKACRKKIAHPYAETLNYTCLNCDKLFVDFKCKGKRTFCSTACKYNYTENV